MEKRKGCVSFSFWVVLEILFLKGDFSNIDFVVIWIIYVLSFIGCRVFIGYKFLCLC